MYRSGALTFFKAVKPVCMGHLYIVSGPSGVGKTTIIDNLLARNERLEKIVAFTTRMKRPGEIADKTYHYISREEFEEKIQRNDFLEYMEFSNHFYGFGLSQKEVLSKLQQGIDLIVDMDYTQILDLKSKIPNCHSIFVLPPSIASLLVRLNSRGENLETISKRMQYAEDIIGHQHIGDTVIINQDDRVEEAIEEILFIIKAHRDDIEELKKFSIV